MAEGALTVAPTATDRDHAIEQLSRHFANDGIEIEEFERRAESVYRATSIAELHALVADVPAVIASTAAARAAASTSLDFPAYDRIAVIMSSTERQGPLRVARHVDVRAVMGSVEIDLTQASFAPGVTDIELKVVMGSVEIVFPEHVRVEYHGTAFMASVETLTGDRGAHANAECVVHVTGKAVMSSVSLMSASAVPH